MRRKAGQDCRECGGKLGRVAVSFGEGWGGLQGVRRKAGQGCRIAEEGWTGLQQVWEKVGEGCRECGGKLGRVAVSFGEGWGGLQVVLRKAGQG